MSAFPPKADVYALSQRPRSAKTRHDSWNLQNFADRGEAVGEGPGAIGTTAGVDERSAGVVRPGRPSRTILIAIGSVSMLDPASAASRGKCSCANNET